MKKILLLIFILLSYCHTYSQELKSIDSTLRKIDANLGELKDHIIEKDAEPFTGQSIFEDRKGNSAIFLPYGGTFRLNTTDASLKLSMAYSLTTKPFFYGFDISGKTHDGILSLISKGNISPGAKINAILGFKELFNDSNLLDGWVVLKVGYEGASFKLFNPDSSFKNQIKKTSFNAFTSSVAFNLKIGGNKILAASVGYQKANNYDELDEVELTDKKTIINSATNTTRTYESQIKARSGDYTVSNQVPISLDFFWTPNNNPRIGFYHYWRTLITDGKTTNGFGSGLYLLKKNNPLSSIAGIVLEVNDISKLSNGFDKNFTLNFVVAYNFGFAKK
jgi:hypothetical protein